jgi:hypothetical protein
VSALRGPFSKNLADCVDRIAVLSHEIFQVFGRESKGLRPIEHTQRSVNARAEPGCRSTKGTQLNGAAAAILRNHLIRVGVPGSLSLIDMRDSMPRAVARMLNSRHRYFPAAMNRVLQW